MMSDTQLDEKWGLVIPLLLVLETLCALVNGRDARGLFNHRD